MSGFQTQTTAEVSDPIMEMSMTALRIIRRLSRDALAGNEYAAKVLEEEGNRA